jgi:hypothetical protein
MSNLSNRLLLLLWCQRPLLRLLYRLVRVCQTATANPSQTERSPKPLLRSGGSTQPHRFVFFCAQPEKEIKHTDVVSTFIPRAGVDVVCR